MKNEKKEINKKNIVKIIGFITLFFVLFLLIWFMYIYPRKVFNDNEKILKEAGNRYYQINKSRLPKDEGRVISVSLSTLIKQKYLDDLHQAYGNKLCDINESNVKAINKNGEYQYYTYLKCGNYESNVDHEGPEIILNGSKKITINKGDKYNELGIKKVNDNVDGKIDVSKVSIKSNVNTSKVGEYEVIYAVEDSLGNKTEIVRKVMVKENLALTVKKNTTNGYYVGDVSNNYIYFNNMLFRIVRVNSDDSVLIVSDDALANVDYTNNGSFIDSSLDKWLNDYFYSLLDPVYQDLIVSSTWCDDSLSKSNITTKECSRTTKKREIGILSIQDYNNSYDGKSSYLDKSNFSWYSNVSSDNKAWAMTTTDKYPNTIIESDEYNLLNVVPALTLKKDTFIVDGDGSYSNPYVIVNVAKARKSSKLNKRQVGEYIKYSGYLFRISDVLDDGTVEVIMDSVLKINAQQISIGYTSKEKVYNPSKKGNIGYKIKNEMTRYIDTKLFVTKKVKVPIYNKRITYKGKRDIKEYNLLISIPSTFDIFSAKSRTSNNTGYWLIDSSKDENIKAVVRSLGTVTYSTTSPNILAGVKIKAYFDKDTLIKSGNGTYLSPYILID